MTKLTKKYYKIKTQNKYKDKIYFCQNKNYLKKVILHAVIYF